MIDMAARISIDPQTLRRFCRRNHIRRLSLFGSVLRDDFGLESDVDVLVEFEKDHVPGFLSLDAMSEKLSALFGGRRIDLVTAKALNDRIRDRVLASAEVAYAEG